MVRRPTRRVVTRVDVDGGVKFFVPSEDFTLPSVPRSFDAYLAYCERTVEFVNARNERIDQLALMVRSLETPEGVARRRLWGF